MNTDDVWKCCSFAGLAKTSVFRLSGGWFSNEVAMEQSCSAQVADSDLRLVFQVISGARDLPQTSEWGPGTLLEGLNSDLWTKDSDLTGLSYCRPRNILLLWTSFQTGWTCDLDLVFDNSDLSEFWTWTCRFKARTRTARTWGWPQLSLRNTSYMGSVTIILGTIVNRNLCSHRRDNCKNLFRDISIGLKNICTRSKSWVQFDAFRQNGEHLASPNWLKECCGSPFQCAVTHNDT